MISFQNENGGKINLVTEVDKNRLYSLKFMVMRYTDLKINLPSTLNLIKIDFGSDDMKISMCEITGYFGK